MQPRMLVLAWLAPVRRLSASAPLLSRMPITPSGQSPNYLWVHASDYFVCRDAHFPAEVQAPEVAALGKEVTTDCCCEFPIIAAFS